MIKKQTFFSVNEFRTNIENDENRINSYKMLAYNKYYKSCTFLIGRHCLHYFTFNIFSLRTTNYT